MKQGRKRTGKRKMTALAVCICGILLLSGCEKRENPNTEKADSPTEQKDEITLMHVEAGRPEFEAYIREAEKELDMKIYVKAYPVNADSRHAKVSSLLSAGDSSVDIFALNDEMMSSFKGAGYLEPLGEEVLSAKDRKMFPQEYLEQMSEAEGQLYGVPYQMDVLTLWCNEKWLQEAGILKISNPEEFLAFLSRDWGENRYAYGGAWEKTYVFNEIGEFINLFGGDYFDWENEKTREAVTFLKECMEKGYTSKEQLIDQYEQLNQKFLDGKYGMIFMYSSALNLYEKAGAFGEERIHIVPLPLMGENVTYMAAWQYALNKSSRHKEAARRFLQYAASKEGARQYAERMNQLPVRSDLLREENLDVAGAEQFREYLQDVKLKARPIPENPMNELAKTGEYFQRFVLGEWELETYCRQMQELVDGSSGKTDEK